VISLIPFWIAGFVIEAFVCFAIAERVRNRTARTLLRMTGAPAGPIFFVVLGIFSGWKRQKVFEMEWLTGRPASEYLGYDQRGEKAPGDLVVLKRQSGHNHDCFDELVSGDLAKYLAGLSTHTVRVRYVVTYDFYRVRGFKLETVGEFGKDTTSANAISRGARSAAKNVVRRQTRRPASLGEEFAPLGICYFHM
jgi:hypothetical protein